MKTLSLTCRMVSAAALLMASQPLRAQNSNPILFVTQVAPAIPHHTVTSIDGSLLASTAAAPRGGDLMIVYPDRSVRNLTRDAGFGISTQLQAGDNAIAVRDPHVHFSGTKALFSMVKGAPADASDTRSFYWQIYEITGFGQTETPVITLVPNQNPAFNNVQPAYLSDGRIVFSTDCTVTGERHLYPAIDEKGMGPAGTGLWTVDPQAAGRAPVMLTHAPSGAFEPFVDSFGRVMFTRWDLLQRDELAHTQGLYPRDYQSEAANATYGNISEVFPEPLPGENEPFGLAFDLFLPWTINQDGHELNTLNHLGRHELTPDFPRSGSEAGLENFQASVPDLPPGGALPANTRATSFLHLSEHPSMPGRYLGVDVLATSVSAGRAVSVLVPPTLNPDEVTVSLISQLGLARDTSWLADNRLMGSWVPGPQLQHSHYGGDPNQQPIPPDFIPTSCFTIRIATGPTRLDRGTSLVAPVTLTTTQFVSGAEVTRTANLWQLQPAEVRSRTVPPPITVPLETPEASAFIAAGVSPSGFRTWLRDNNKAIISSRNVLNRDGADRQQPFSLALPDNGLSNTVPGAFTHTVDRVQFFTGEYLRAYAPEAGTSPNPGRRITARPVNEEAFASNPPSPGPGGGSVNVAPDGSMAAIVPAGRAMTWQLSDPQDNAVVRERYWLSFHAGEIRMCTSCHQVNTESQSGTPGAKNSPEALRSLLSYWKSANPAAPGPATSYRVWSEVKLNNSSDATLEQDNDGDGLTNLEEFVYGGNPLVPLYESDGARPFTAIAGSAATTLRFTRNQDATGSEVIAESSGNLADWQEAARVTDAGAIAQQGRTITDTSTAAQSSGRLTEWEVSVPSPPGTARQFFRLRFTVP